MSQIDGDEVEYVDENADIDDDDDTDDDDDVDVDDDDVMMVMMIMMNTINDNGLIMKIRRW